MYTISSQLLKEQNQNLSNKVANYVKENFPFRTTEYDKCTRDISYIIQALADCIEQDHTNPIDDIAGKFFHNGKLLLKSTGVEFEAYNYLLTEIKNIVDAETYQQCEKLIYRFKSNMTNGIVYNNDNIPQTATMSERFKKALYGWDDEREVMLNMQRCQRNWNYERELPYEVVDYFMWIAKNAPSKQHEAYYDVYYSTDRETIEYLYQFTWGSTESRDPPAMWRNSQANANMYMIFVCKVPPTMYNCNNDGSSQDHFGESRWENAIVSVGMAMSLVMRAANKMGLRTGPNKVKDLGPDYNYEWEKLLGIYDDVKAGKKRMFFGLGIGFENLGRHRWESDDTELAIGASNGHNMTVKWNEPDFEPLMPNGQEKRKVEIVDIKERVGEQIIDPYGNIHTIPNAHEIKINTVRDRDVKGIEIPKK